MAFVCSECAKLDDGMEICSICAASAHKECIVTSDDSTWKCATCASSPAVENEVAHEPITYLNQFIPQRQYADMIDYYPSVGLICLSLELMLGPYQLAKLAVEVSKMFATSPDKDHHECLTSFHDTHFTDTSYSAFITAVRGIAGSDLFDALHLSLLDNQYQFAVGFQPSLRLFREKCPGPRKRQRSRTRGDGLDDDRTAVASGCSAFKYFHTFCFKCARLFDCKERSVQWLAHKKIVSAVERRQLHFVAEYALRLQPYQLSRNNKGDFEKAALRGLE